MKCYLCRGKAGIKQQKGRSICNDCFVRMIEKRVRKYSRINKLFKKGDKILVKDSVDKYFVKSILKDMPVKFVNKNADKEVVLWTLDDEVNEFISALFSGGKVKKSKEIRLLKNVSDKELGLFAKIKKLKFKANKKDNDVQKFLDEIEKKHPNIKYNLIKNIYMLNRLT